MKIECPLSFSDYKAALKLHSRLSLLRRINRIALFVSSLIIYSIFGYVVIKSAVNHEFASRISAGTWITFLSLSCLPLLHSWALRRQFRNIFPPSPTSRIAYFEFCDDLVISGIPGVSEGRYHWSSIVQFAQNEEITLVYVKKSRFLFVPTHAFSASQRIELDELIARHGVKR